MQMGASTSSAQNIQARMNTLRSVNQGSGSVGPRRQSTPQQTTAVRMVGDR